MATAIVNTYPLENYSFENTNKSIKPPKYFSYADRISRFKSNYQKDGMRTSVGAILVVHQHRHPHLLVLKTGDARVFYDLPGGRLRPGEDEIEGLRRKLNSKLGDESDHPSLHRNWQIGEYASIWWRPSFEYTMYPYCPPHITKPKECKKLVLVHLSERDYFVVPRNCNLVAIPFLELYDNYPTYGHILSSIPEQLSRFQFDLIQQ